MSEPISVSHVDKLLKENTFFLGVEEVAITDAPQRFIAEDITAESDNPPFDRIMMDGIACRADTKFPLKIVGIAAAGDKTQTLPEGSYCLEAMTGSPLPHGADCIVPVEDIIKENGLVTLRPGIELEAGRFIHPRGTDIKKGQLVLSKGHLITAPVSAALAANGFSTVKVAKRPRVAVICTGNELIPVDEKLGEAQVRRSNDYMLASFFKQSFCEKITRLIAPDNAAKTEEVVKQALAENDIIMLSGGVSKGKFDFVPGALEAAGVKLLCRSVRSTPGGPVHFGVTDDRKLAFGAPGNPISSLASAVRYVGPYIRRAQGEPEEPAPIVRLTSPLKAFDKKTRFIPVKLDPTKPGSAIPMETATSGDFQTIARADGMVQVPSKMDLEDVVKADKDGAIVEAYFYGW